VTDAHNEIGPTIADAEGGSKLRTESGHLDRLVDESSAQVQSGGLQGKPQQALVRPSVWE
jgi:hypothetical protein